MNPISLFILVCLVLAACGLQRSPGSSPSDVGNSARLTVFAAASLTDPFQEISREFEVANPGVVVTLNFAGSQQLALQIEQGAQADVLATADQRSMDRVVAAGLIPQTEPQPFAHNRMVVILPTGNPGEIGTLVDLARPGVRVILAGEQVPAGVYARQVLDKLSADPAFGSRYGEAVLGNAISHEENVKQVVAKVVLGEADAGLVYCSDVAPAVMDKVQRLEIPDAFNVRTTYPISTLGDAAEPELAVEFVDFVLGPAGQTILQEWGLQGVER